VGEAVKFRVVYEIDVPGLRGDLVAEDLSLDVDIEGGPPLGYYGVRLLEITKAETSDSQAER
jgi:hypothetical protein